MECFSNELKEPLSCSPERGKKIKSDEHEDSDGLDLALPEEATSNI